jgi:hypothetical protein
MSSIPALLAFFVGAVVGAGALFVLYVAFCVWRVLRATTYGPLRVASMGGKVIVSFDCLDRRGIKRLLATMVETDGVVNFLYSPDDAMALASGVARAAGEAELSVERDMVVVDKEKD